MCAFRVVPFLFLGLIAAAAQAQQLNKPIISFGKVQGTVQFTRSLPVGIKPLSCSNVRVDRSSIRHPSR